MLSLLYGAIVGSLLAVLGFVKNCISSRRLVTTARGTREAPRMVAVISAKNEEAVIGQTARFLLADMPVGDRLVVVNDGSSDATVPLLENLRCSFPNLVLLHNRGIPGKHGAINTALEHTSEPLILLLDADAMLEQEGIERYRQIFRDPRVQAIYADFTSSNEHRSLAVIFQGVFFSFAKAFVFSGLFATPPFMSSGLFIRREVFTNVGEFSRETISDDFNLFLRMRKQRMRATFVLGPRFRIQYAFRIKDLVGQLLRWYTRVLREVFVQIRQRRYTHISGIVGLGILLFFPYIIIAIGYGASLPVFLHAVLPGEIAAIYFAILVAYLFHEARHWREVLINASVGIPLFYLLFQGVILVAFVRAFRKTQTWYRVTREEKKNG